MESTDDFVSANISKHDIMWILVYSIFVQGVPVLLVFYPKARDEDGEATLNVLTDLALHKELNIKLIAVTTETVASLRKQRASFIILYCQGKGVYDKVLWARIFNVLF